MLEESRHRNQASANDSVNSDSTRVLQQKVLDPTSAKRLREIRSQYQFVESTLREVDYQLDSQWEEYQKKQKKHRYYCVDVLIIGFSVT